LDLEVFGDLLTQHLDTEAEKELRGRTRDPRIFVGRGTYGAPRFVLYSAEDRIEIDRYCSIAESTIVGGGEHNYRSTSTFPFHWYHGDDPGSQAADPTQIRYHNAVYKGATRIGCDVWIGFGATILSGVTVGHGAVIGAAAVVASDVPPYAVMIGNPARCLKKRFDDATIERLLAIRWWQWKPEYIHKFQDLLFSAPEEFFRTMDALPDDDLSAMYETDPRAIDLAFRPPDLPPPEMEAIQVSSSHLQSSKIRGLVRQILPPIVYSALYRLTH
jgi:acetyltransferase-like isoleucine patch superfamily enzyme